MAWIGLPINVVVIHGANHVTIQKRGIHWIGLEARHERRGSAFPTALANGRVRRGGHGPGVFQQNPSVFLLTSAKRAADGIEPEQFRRLNRLRRKIYVFQSASPLSDRVR